MVKRKKSRGMLALCATVMTLVTACGGGGGPPTPPGTPTPPGPPGVEPLTHFEEQLVGAWSRYHGYDGSYQYFIFHSDRTGLSFEIQSNGSRTDQKSITYWALEKDREWVFRVRLAGPGISSEPRGYLSGHEFHYLQDEILRGGYERLRMTRDPSPPSGD